MKICYNCGVELDEHMQACPLCHFSSFDQPAEPTENSSFLTDQQNERLLSDYVKLTKVQKRKLFWEMSGIILFSGILVTLMIDVVTTKGITWSRYSVTVCLVLFANVTLLSFWRHKLFILLGGSFITTSLLLVLLDLYNNKVGWGSQLGIPLLLSIYLIIYIMTRLFRIIKRHGFNILGLVFIASGVLSLCIEAVLSRYFTNKITFEWSLIVFACMVPISAVLFFIHYRLNRGIELRRFFHI
jgi:hypothetical protein